MSADTIEQMADRIAALMDQRLGARGRTLAEKLRHSGRALPRNIRAEAEVLALAADQAAHPKLMRQIDQDQITRAYDLCLRHLQGLDRGALRRGAAMDIASSIAFRLFVVAALLAVVLWWRGLI